jgi:hypothetical protein
MRFRPHITLLFILSVFTVLLFTSLFIPKEGIPLFGDMKIRFFSPEELFKPKTKYADISEIIALNQFVEDTTVVELPVDTLPFAIDTLRANADSLKQSIRKIEFPEGNHQLLFPTFKAMENATTENKVVRIMHFGDSQIEGDRITSFVRNRLQKKFGGSGVGLIPASQLYDFSFSIFQDASDNWHRYTLYGRRDTNLTHNRYGIMAGFNTFTRQPIDSPAPEPSNKTAWISVNKSPYSYQNTKSFEQCRLFYGHNTDSFSLSLIVNDEIADSGFYSPSDGLRHIQWFFNEPVDNIYMEFGSNQSPEIYGIALDAKNGVAVDNIAMRGCAGLVFNKTDPSLFSELVSKMDVELMILQFGGNVVPNIRKNYDYYERWFYAQLAFIKQYAPGVQIIVIGPSDMSRKVNNHYESYPNIELVRDALKAATFRANAAYWDMFEAMGGENSMPSWVFAQPSLATKDFVHFTPRGAKIIANMFYNALMYEYSLYTRQNTSSLQ